MSDEEQAVNRITSSMQTLKVEKPEDFKNVIKNIAHEVDAEKQKKKSSTDFD